MLLFIGPHWEHKVLDFLCLKISSKAVIYSKIITFSSSYHPVPSTLTPLILHRLLIFFEVSCIFISVLQMREQT